MVKTILITAFVTYVFAAFGTHAALEHPTGLDGGLQSFGIAEAADRQGR